MKNIFFSIFLCVSLAGCSIDKKFEEHCRSLLPASEMAVEVSMPEFVLNTDTSERQLSAWLYSSDKANFIQNGVATGLTKATLNYKVIGSVNYFEFMGKSCGTPNLSLKINLIDPVVYVAREYAPGTCRHKAIYQHELKHVAIHKAHLTNVKSTIEQYLTNKYGNGFLFRSGGLSNMQNELDTFVNEELTKFVSTELDKGSLLQKSIDTLEEYSRLGAECDQNVGEVYMSRPG